MHLHSRSRVLYVLLISTIIVVGLSFAFLYIFPSYSINSNTNSVSALTYSSDTDVSFTFNPTLSISLSNTNITIDNLLPGLSSESSPITVSVGSNTPYGYSLFASVGNSTDYNTTSLVHKSNDNSNNNSNNNSIPVTFTSIATNASLPQLDTDNTWGYSFSNDNGSTWSNYNGLPLYSTVGNNTSTNNPALLIDTKSPADSTKSIGFKIAAKASATQASGTYNNVINFYAVGKPEPDYLYDEISKMSKGKQTRNDLQAVMNRPTSPNYLEDTSNSGVYEYDPSIFGDSSDSNNNHKIYYYRGFLEPQSDKGLHGSDGKATTYPNYVKLDNDTCWRIVRTTGSGGIKIIYNGLWSNDTKTCANNIYTGVYIGNAPFNDEEFETSEKTYYGMQYQNIQSIGYTYSNKIPLYTTTYQALEDLFGARGDDFSTNTNSSIVKQYIEDWYDSNMQNNNYNYTNYLEKTASYCNDRTIYYKRSYYYYEETNGVIPYNPSPNRVYYSGGYIRNDRNAYDKKPSLGCPRGAVDTYSTDTRSGGNGQLRHPIALLTADEAFLAGASRSNNGMFYLETGDDFWLLSPFSYSDNSAGYCLSQDSSIKACSVNYSMGVRPVISLKSGTFIISGAGTSTDPWRIDG